MTRQLNNTTTKMARHNTTTKEKMKDNTKNSKGEKKNVLNPFTCEDIARQILEREFNKHFFMPSGTMEYDIIGADGQPIEIKSTCNRKSFNKNTFWWHGNQKNQNLCAIHVDDSKLKEGELIINWKFIEKHKKKIPLKETNLDLSHPSDFVEFKKIMKKKRIEIKEKETEKVTTKPCKSCLSQNFYLVQNEAGEKWVMCAKCHQNNGNLEREKK